MGATRQGRRDQVGGRPLSVPATARVVPNVPSFSVDEGFVYSIPDHLVDAVEVGSIVRVPLGGRRVRGWVVEIGGHDRSRLKDIGALSGEVPVFDRRLLQGLRWAAQHYVAPISVLLAQATPPTLPKRVGGVERQGDLPIGDHVLTEVAVASAEGRRQPTRVIVGTWTDMSWVSSLGAVTAARRSAVVIAATVAEAKRIADVARRGGQSPVLVAGGTDAEITGGWQRVQAPGALLVGTPRVATWRIGGLALVVMLEEGRRAMKERQTPTIHVREMIRTRGLLEGFSTVVFGPTPSVEVLAAGAEISHIGNRAWPLVEVVDRSEDAPGSGFLSERVVAALKATVEAGGMTFVFTHRRAGYASMRCTNCRSARQCPRCGSLLGRVDACPTCSAETGPCHNCGRAEFEELGSVPERLVTEINRKLRAGVAAVYPGDASVNVGTERDLASLPPAGLVVAADVDGMSMSHGYRASEEALRQLARLANSLAPGSGRRMMVQTSTPESQLIATLRRGDPIPYLEAILVQRARDGFPPSQEMIAVEIRGRDDVDLVAELGEHGGDAIGPMRLEGGRRWLLQGDLSTTRLALRDVVGRLRETGATVRVDADPIDL